MDYERGLKAMRELAEGAAWYADFLPHESALTENLRDERRYGPSEQTRRDRTRIVDQLNTLALAHIGISFNQLCVGTPPGVPPVAVAPPVGGRGPSRPKDGFKYDTFLSYSHKDRDWVRTTFLPKLEQAKVRVCIDFRDFEIGVPSLINMENAVKQSRRTLLVLTPDWIASEFTAFESLLVQTSDPGGVRRRTLPLMVRDCKLPDRLGILTYLDMTDPTEFTTQMERLVKAIFTPVS